MINKLSPLTVAPNNPYYLLRGSEHFEHRKDELRQKGGILLKTLGHEVTDYMDWDEQRWNQGGPAYGSIHTIHELKPVQQRSRSIFGFK